jgi:hypothetical protein
MSLHFTFTEAEPSADKPPAISLTSPNLAYSHYSQPRVPSPLSLPCLPQSLQLFSKIFPSALNQSLKAVPHPQVFGLPLLVTLLLFPRVRAHRLAVLAEERVARPRPQHH